MAESTLLFDKSLERLKIIYCCTGLILETKKINRNRKLMKRCFYIFNFIWLNSDIVGAVFWFIDGIKIGRDMTALTYLAPCSTYSVVGTTKSLYLIKYETQVNDLIDNLRELENTAKEVNAAVRNKIEKRERRFLNFVINLLNLLNFGLIVTFTFSPMILIVIKYIRTKELELQLPFLDVYPFDSLNIKYWPFVYVKQIWSEFIVILDICGVDYLYYIFCAYIRIHFLLLKHEFENFIPHQQRTNENIDKEIRQKFAKLVQWHQKIISSASTLEIIYAKSTLFNFVLSSVIICLTGFNVVATDNFAFLVTFLTFLFMSLLQIFFLCLFGDMIMRSSMEVGDAVYNSLWYSGNGRIGKDVLIVLTRAQKPCKLTAFGFTEVNLRAFNKIVSTAWSYFALLKTMYTAGQQ